MSDGDALRRPMMSGWTDRSWSSTMTRRCNGSVCACAGSVARAARAPSSAPRNTQPKGLTSFMAIPPASRLADDVQCHVDLDHLAADLVRGGRVLRALSIFENDNHGGAE